MLVNTFFILYYIICLLECILYKQIIYTNFIFYLFHYTLIIYCQSISCSFTPEAPASSAAALEVTSPGPAHQNSQSKCLYLCPSLPCSQYPLCYLVSFLGTLHNRGSLFICQACFLEGIPASVCQAVPCIIRNNRLECP